VKGNIILLIFALVLGVVCLLLPDEKDDSSPDSQVLETHGAIASYYGDQFQGRCMANGNIFDKEDMVAAHRTLPLGTKVRVHRGAYSVDVTVTDRGPYIDGRHLDLSEGAARKLGMLDKGVSPVVIDVLEKPAKNKKYHKRYKRCLARQQQTHSNNPGHTTGVFFLLRQIVTSRFEWGVP
jgi:rare lipoprotein A